LNTLSPTHEPPSPSLGYICSSEDVWHRPKSSINVGNFKTAPPERASQVLSWLRIQPRFGLHGSNRAMMLSSRALRTRVLW